MMRWPDPNWRCPANLAAMGLTALAALMVWWLA